VLDSSDLLQLDRLPESLCIVGAGVIGMGFASIFSTFGTKVTVVEFLKECLPALDSDIAKRLRKVLEKRGLDFCLQSAVTAITADGVVRAYDQEDEKIGEAVEVPDHALIWGTKSDGVPVLMLVSPENKDEKRTVK
jgi:dihydrolipoamide dehydrogenase